LNGRSRPAPLPIPALNIDISEEAGVRYLHFGSSWIQGAMRIARPFALELDYTREMMVPLLLHGPTGRAACCRSGWAPPR
jgi:spermidine synthase